MDFFQAFVLGTVQGFTELLPISSSAHLFLIPWIFKWNIPESFDVALHFGTLLAIILFFGKDWINLIKGGIRQIKGEKNTEAKMLKYIIIATIPGGIIGFLLDHYAQEVMNNPLIIALALIIMGITLYVVDILAKNEVKYEEMTFKQTFLIGLSQALAFIPGVSRSGITMTTGRMLGVKREACAKYSFMLSTPIVLGATIYKLNEFTFNLSFVVGVLTSLIVGIFVIKVLLEYLKKGSYKVFAIYRVILGLSVVILIYLRIC